MRSISLLVGIIFTSLCLDAQYYTSYFTGNSTDVVTTPTGGVCMMGGATEDDNAMIWFLERANGGDVLVLRASGSDGYNDYLYSELGVTVNSVETIVFNYYLANQDEYVLQKIQQAEAIWFAGGDQWNYVDYWRDRPVDSLINLGLSERNIVIGGTSAGMAILGEYYFSAEYGTVTSANALANPYTQNVTVDSTDFLHVNYLNNVVTDTHYDDPDRKGRHVVFLARMLQDYGANSKGIACDEYTAVCIDPEGIAHVYGGYPQYDDNAYFVQLNCELVDQSPETCVEGIPLEWYLGGEALNVYQVKGTANGENTFDLNDWNTGNGGEWLNWYVQDGGLTEVASTQPGCNGNSVGEEPAESLVVYPNPAGSELWIDGWSEADSVEIYDYSGRWIESLRVPENGRLSIDHLPDGTFLLKSTAGLTVSFIKETE
ncbi:MAG: Type 1 glutamine amidotransferase-like domain-containing protein [Flavobacteriales bacterium]|nr:Type 1 glutamine amidotransferase-like domain-containing protein [Flavobacteriales bacterium]